MSQSTTEANLQTLLDLSQDQQVVVDDQGRIVWANRAACQILAAQSLEIGEVWPHAPEVGAELPAHSDRPGLQVQRAQTCSWGGAPAVLLTLGPRTAADPTTPVTSDDRFLSHIAEQFSAPMEAAYQFTGILTDGVAGELTGTQHEYLSIVAKNIRQLRQLVKHLVDVVRVTQGNLRVEPECFSMVELLTEVYSTWQAKALQRGVRFDLAISDGLPLALADRGRIREAIGTVLDRALAASVIDDRLELRCDARGGLRQPPTLRLEVVARHRQGRGFASHNSVPPESDQFDVGLLICREIIHRHGGNLVFSQRNSNESVAAWAIPAYSLESQLRALVFRGEPVIPAVSLVAVRLESQMQSVVRKISPRVMRAMQSLLGSCVIPSQDLLLPWIPKHGPVEHLYVVSCSDVSGAQRIAHRIQRRLWQQQDKSRQRCEMKVQAIAIRPSQVAQDGAADALIEQLAGAIRAELQNFEHGNPVLSR